MRPLYAGGGSALRKDPQHAGNRPSRDRGQHHAPEVKREQVKPGGPLRAGEMEGGLTGERPGRGQRSRAPARGRRGNPAGRGESGERPGRGEELEREAMDADWRKEPRRCRGHDRDNE